MTEPLDFTDRWREALAEHLARRERIARLRAELAVARRAGLEARHRQRLNRTEEHVSKPNLAARLQRELGQRIGAWPVGPGGPHCVVKGCAEPVRAGTLICPRHSEALRQPEPTS
jgi:hypothetical protein